MRRRLVLAIASGLAATLVVACARAPEPRTNATADSNLEPSADARADADADAGGDARVPGLPMPQQFPRFVWDAAGAPRDAATR